MQVGEVLSMESCLYALVIRSANEVAAQIAEHVGGTEQNFIDMMNQRAAEIGCTNTHFVNASGLPDENHYSTALDCTSKILNVLLYVSGFFVCLPSNIIILLKNVKF